MHVKAVKLSRLRPAVSVLLMTYNRRAYLNAAMDGVRRQICRDWEMIVLDGGSNDGSLPWLRRHLLPPERLIEFSDNPGPVALMNAGIQAARGAFIAFLEADDYWLPGYLEAMTQVFREGSLQWLSSGCIVIDGRGRVVNAIGAKGRWLRSPRRCSEEGKTVLPWENDPLLLKLTGRSQHGLLSMSMVRRSIFTEIGTFDPVYRWTAMEMDFICRLALARGRAAFGFVDKILGVRRHHAGQLTNVPGPWSWKAPVDWGADCVKTRRQKEFYTDLACYFSRHRDAIRGALKTERAPIQ